MVLTALFPCAGDCAGTVAHEVLQMQTQLEEKVPILPYTTFMRTRCDTSADDTHALHSSRAACSCS